MARVCRECGKEARVGPPPPLMIAELRSYLGIEAGVDGETCLECDSMGFALSDVALLAMKRLVSKAVPERTKGRTKR